MGHLGAQRLNGRVMILKGEILKIEVETNEKKTNEKQESNGETINIEVESGSLCERMVRRVLHTQIVVESKCVRSYAHTHTLTQRTGAFLVSYA